MSQIFKLMNKTNTSYRELGSGDAKNTDLFFDKDHRDFFGDAPTITVRLDKNNIAQAFLFIASMLPKKFDSSSVHENRYYSEEFVDTGIRKIDAVFGTSGYKDFTWSVRKDVIKKNGEVDDRLYLNNLISDHHYATHDGQIVNFKFTIRDYLLGGYSTLKLEKDGNSDLIKLWIINSCTPEFSNEEPSSQLTSDNDLDYASTQTIYYGCPGTGKSFEVKMIAEGKHGEKTIWYEKATNDDKTCRKISHGPSEEEKKMLDNNVFRTTFHPDYDYATFVGCYKPLKDDDGKLDYRFIPQVFTNAYVSAFRHPDDPTYLIIEEINRGNCAQIFGDLFQLLDRTGGESDYGIKPDTELAKYLASEGVPSQSLKLPDNLHIYATMNTSDQSLFPMDSAFKRRWAMEYKPIDHKHGKAMKFTITIDGKEYPWIGFLQMVNEMILNATDSEDKQMGEFFIKSSITEKEFVNKVMFYLWNDICKDLYNPRRVQAPYFLRVKDKLEEEKNDYFTFAELFSERNKDSRLLNGFILYLEDKFKESHKDIPLTEDKRIDWKTIIENTVPTPGTE